MLQSLGHLVVTVVVVTTVVVGVVVVATVVVGVDVVTTTVVAAAGVVTPSHLVHLWTANPRRNVSKTRHPSVTCRIPLAH